MPALPAARVSRRLAVDRPIAFKKKTVGVNRISCLQEFDLTEIKSPLGLLGRAGLLTMRESKARLFLDDDAPTGECGRIIIDACAHLVVGNKPCTRVINHDQSIESAALASKCLGQPKRSL